MSATGKSACPSDVTDEQRDLLPPYFTLLTEEAPQRIYRLRDLFHAIRYVVRNGVEWRYLPDDFPPVNRRVSAGSPLAACGCV